jgi:amino acid transporter
MPEQRQFAPTVQKPPLAPRQAVFINLGGLAVDIVGAVLACTIFLVPLWQALAGFAIVAFFVLAFPWVSLDWRTRNRAVRAHNLFICFFVATLIVTVIVQWGTEGLSFPMWGVAAVVIAGLAAYSVMAYYAIINFRRWRRGDFRSLDEEKK